jgi:hypothetical protein
MHGFAGRVDDLATFVVNTGMNLVAAVAVLAAVVVARTTVAVVQTAFVVARTTVVVAQTTDIAVVLRTTSVGLVLGSSCLAGSSTGNGLVTTPWALASIRGFTHLEWWYRN